MNVLIMLRFLLVSVCLLGATAFVQAQMAADTLSPAQLQSEFLDEL